MPAEKKPDPKPTALDIAIKLAPSVLASATLLWGIYTYGETVKRTAETRRIEASKPFLDKQLALYSEATLNAATLATSSNPADLAAAKLRFLQLYWGELAMVERGAVESSMVAFKNALDAGKPQTDLARLALKLAYACRDELAVSWGTDAWLRVPKAATP